MKFYPFILIQLFAILNLNKAILPKLETHTVSFIHQHVKLLLLLLDGILFLNILLQLHVYHEHLHRI